MRDLETPPFTVGDTAYTRPAPAGFASAAAVPSTYPADVAYTAPALGGEFQPGQSQAVITKGAPADGGQALLEALHNAPVPPPAPVSIDAAVAVAADKKTATVAMTGGPTAPGARSYNVSVTTNPGAALQTVNVVTNLGDSVARVAEEIRLALEAFNFVTTEHIAGSAQTMVFADATHTIAALTVI
jgi:hypothetical protein